MALTLNIAVNPPTQGAQQTTQAFQQIGTSAQNLNRTLSQTHGAFSSLSQGMSGNLQQFYALSRALSPLSGHFELLAARMERVILVMERIGKATADHATRQQVLSRAFQEGQIAAATMEAALSAVASATQKAETAAKAFAAQQAIVTAAQKEAAAASLLVQQRRMDVLTTRAGGDPKAEALAARDLAAAQQFLLEKQIALKTEQAAAVPIKEAYSNATKGQAAAEVLFTEATEASTIALGPLVLIILAVTAALAAFAAAAYTVGKALKEGLHMDEEIRGLAALTGSLKVAEETYHEFVEIAKHTKFEIPELTRAYQELYTFRRAGIDVGETLKDMTTLTAGPIGNLDKLVSAFTKLEETGTISNRVLRQFAAAGVDLAGILGNYLGKNLTQVNAMLKDNQISIDTIAKAMHAAAAEGGYFSQIMAYLGDSTKQAFKNLRVSWDEFFAELGRPVQPAMADFLNFLASKLTELTPKAKELGVAIGTAINFITALAQSGDVFKSLELAWQLAVNNMVRFIAEAFGTLFSRMGPALADALWEGFKTRWYYLALGGAGALFAFDWKKASEGLVNTLVGGLKDPKLDAANKELMDKLAKMWADARAKAEGQAGGAPLPSGGGAAPPPIEVDKLKEFNMLLQQQQQILEKIKFEQRLVAENVFLAPDAKAAATLKLMQTEYDQIGASIAKLEVIKPGITDPEELQKANGQLLKMQQEMTMLALKMNELKHPFATEFANWAASFGTFAHQAVGALQQIEQAMQSAFTDSFVEIINGTKSASAAFRDMAMSMIKDIERIVINLMIQLAIQRLLGMVAGSGTVSMTGATGWYSGQAGFAAGPVTRGVAVGAQTGGMIPGQGSGDRVPVMAEPGEFVINRRSAQRIGYARLRQMNRMQDGGEVGWSTPVYNSRGVITGVWTPNGFIEGATPSWYSPSGGQGPTGSAPGGWIDPIALGSPTYSGGAFDPTAYGGITAPFPTATGVGGPSGGGGGPSNVSAWTQGLIPGTSLSAADRARIAANLGTGGRGVGMWGAPMGSGFGMNPLGSFGVHGMPSYFGGSINISAAPGVFAPGGLGTGIYGPGTMGSAGVYGSHAGFGAASISKALYQSGVARLGTGLTGPVNYNVNLGMPSGPSRGIPMKHAFLFGGEIPSFQSGGVMPHTGLAYLHRGEKVLPDGGGMNVSNSQTNVSVTVVNGGAQNVTATGGGLKESEARELARMITTVVDAQIAKQRRAGGSLYAPRAG